MKMGIDIVIVIFIKFVDLENSNAMNNLALFYEFCKGVDKNISKAVEFYEKAVDLKNSNAMINLAFCYEIGDGVDKNISKAIELYEKAVDLRSPLAIWEIVIQMIHQSVKRNCALYFQMVKSLMPPYLNILTAFNKNNNHYIFLAIFL